MKPWKLAPTVCNGKKHWQASCDCEECGGSASPTFRTRVGAENWCNRMGVPFELDTSRAAYGPGQFMSETGRYNGFTS